MTEISKEYGTALFMLASENGKQREYDEALSLISAVFAENPEYSKLLSAPDLPKQERCGILDEAFRGKVHPYVLNFLKILTEKGYIRRYSDCVEAFRQQYNADHGILCVTAVTAVVLTPAQTEKLSAKLAGITGKTIDLTNRVDPSCIGGMRLDYDGKRVDDTVAHRLEAMGNLLKNTVI